MLVIEDSISGRLGLRGQQRRGRHDHAGLAIAALRDLTLDPGLLNPVGAVPR
jgi:hypothetical protein